MLSRYFEEEGYRVSLAGDGHEMRECLAKQSVDIIFLGLVLPPGGRTGARSRYTGALGCTTDHADGSQ